VPVGALSARVAALSERLGSATRRRAAGGAAFRKQRYAEADAHYRTALFMMQNGDGSDAHVDATESNGSAQAQADMIRACMLNR
jgi:hypothetical protein